MDKELLEDLELLNRALCVPNVNYKLTNKSYNRLKQALTSPTAESIVKDLNELMEIVGFGNRWYYDEKTNEFKATGYWHVIYSSKKLDFTNLPIKLANKLTQFFMNEVESNGER